MVKQLVLSLALLASTAAAADQLVHLDVRDYARIPPTKAFEYQYTVKDAWTPPIFCGALARCVFTFWASESPRIKIDGQIRTLFVVPR